MSKSNTHAAQKLAVAGVLTAAAVVGSFLSVPVAGSKCAPVQHMVNVFSAVLLGPVVGDWHCILCKPDSKSARDRKFSCFSGKHGRSPVLWTYVPFHQEIKSHLCCGSTWNRRSRRTCRLPGCTFRHGTCTCRIYGIHDPVLYLHSGRQHPRPCASPHLREKPGA